MRQEVSRRLTVLADDGRQSWRMTDDSPGKTWTKVLAKDGSFYKWLMIRPSSQIKSNGYQYYFNVIVCSNATFLHDWIKTTELQKGLMSSINGTKKHHALNQ
jgi:hypothetical protein